jgi:hypothetical protein
MSECESNERLEYLFDFQIRICDSVTPTPWRESNLLVWNALEAIHRAIADYGPDEIRLMRARQVLATKTFDLYSCARCAN